MNDAIQKRPRKWRRYLLTIAIMVLLAIVANYIFRGVPEIAASAMRDADTIELLSISPERRRADADFHGFKALGRTTITDPVTRDRLYDAL